MEEIVVTFGDGGVKGFLNGGSNLILRRIGHGRLDRGGNGGFIGLGESPSFVDASHLSDNVIVEPIEADEERADARGKSEDTTLRETIGFEETVFEGSNSILVVLTGAVKWSEIEVRGCLIDVGIRLGCFEEISSIKSKKGGYHE